MSGTITLRVSLRRGHVHDRIFQRLLVIGPCRPLRLQRLLEVVELVRPLLKVLLHGMKFPFERLVFQLDDIMR